MLVFIFSVMFHLFYLKDIDTIFSMQSPWTLTALIIATAFFFLKTLDVVFWTPSRNSGFIKTPRLFIDVLNFILLAIVILILVSQIFHKPITGILAASGALGVIVGLSMQRMLADLFTGVAINMDNTIKLMDWIEYNKPNGDPIIGQVREVNWRTVKLLTYDNNIVVIPNGALATDSIKNFSNPTSKSMFIIDLTMDFEVPSARVLTLLEAAVISVKEVLENPKPKIYIDCVTERGVQYAVRFWLDINVVNIFEGKHLVYNSALKHLHQGGLSLSYSKHDIYYKPMPTRQLDRHRDIGPLLKRVPLFTMLNNSELNIIHKGVSEVAVNRGEAVVRAGEAGSSMFILVEGAMNVIVDKITNGKIKKIKVNQLVPGDFFGEMSLLTGEPRSAYVIARTDSILYEIKKKTIMQVLKGRPEVSRKLSRILADRVMSNESAKIKYKDNKAKLASTLFSRMKEFFFGI